jgi:hypothetical protein
MVRLNMPGLEEAIRRNEERLRRARDLSGVASEIDQALADDHARQFSDNPIGDNSGQLYQSIVDTRHGEHVFALTGDTIFFGTLTRYAQYVARRRPLIRLTATAARQIRRIIVQYVRSP